MGHMPLTSAEMVVLIEQVIRTDFMPHVAAEVAAGVHAEVMPAITEYARSLAREEIARHGSGVARAVHDFLDSVVAAGVIVEGMVQIDAHLAPYNALMEAVGRNVALRSDD